MEQKENEIKGKELFELSLTFTEGDEEKQFSTSVRDNELYLKAL
jgi:hypothetical protein